MTARVILSFDCEGKWGIADHLDAEAHRALADDRLKQAYGRILSALDVYDIQATFAVVGCFSLSPAELEKIRDRLRALASHFPDMLGPALSDCFSGSRQGWSGEWAVDAIGAMAQRHELALHGATHVPWNSPYMTKALARSELAFAFEAGIPLCSRAKTFIYPRNAVAYPELLAERGFIAYRAAKAPRSRLRSLASEFNVFAKAEDDPAGVSCPLPIPAGYFVNWQHGPRRAVPRAVSRLRARNILAHAAKTGKVVHFWSHPENFATAPGTYDVFTDLLREIAELRERGGCEVLTQEHYALRQISPTAA